MVSIQHTTFISPSTDLTAQSWLEMLAHTFSPAQLAVLQRACALAEPHYAGKFELTGTPLMQHALGTASILVAMHMDHETLAASILYAIPVYLPDWQEVLSAQFGASIAMLVEGISRMEQIQRLSELSVRATQDAAAHAQQIEALRKMLLAMVQDIRVVLIKLAERTQALRSLASSSAELQQRVAQTTRNIFAPLANRLGVWQMKWELEDLSVRYLEPSLYKKIAKLLDERRVDREQYIADFIARLHLALQHAGIAAEVTGRPKHIYSIINKMQRKQLDFNELYDVRAVRILVKDVQACYTALSIVHELWPAIQSEFDDYIARPKSNDYQSLHTAVIGPRGLAVEVQIRTHEMHQHSELGVAAHWRYKEGKQSEAGFDEKIAWLRQILEWQEDIAERVNSLAKFNHELFHDRVYVLTPQGKIIDLPKGATPVDFAYSLHTDLGHRTRGAKVDGSIVSLNYKLQNGQRVEILTTKIGAPSRDWINPNLGFLQSSRARAKVRNWFNNLSLDDSIAQGRAQLDKELQRLGVSAVNQEKLAQRLHFNKLDELLAALGRGLITPRRVALAIQQELPQKIIEAAKPKISKAPDEKLAANGIVVGGIGNLTTQLAKCCNPVAPQAIVGYITRDRGITIHRDDCPFMLRMLEARQERKLSAQWSTQLLSKTKPSI